MEVMKIMRQTSQTKARVAKITYPLLSAAMDSFGVTEATMTKADKLPVTPLPYRIAR